MSEKKIPAKYALEYGLFKAHFLNPLNPKTRAEVDSHIGRLLEVPVINKCYETCFL